MRKWRVGTVSMGISLLLLGVFLLVSVFANAGLYSVFMSWWPMILVILGIEILLAQCLRGKHDPTIQYDVFSILFIGFLGTVAVSFAIVSSIGITEKVSAAITGQEITSDLPVVEENVASSIERIVLETNQENVSIEGTNQRSLHVFGTFRQYISAEDDLLITDTTDFVTIHEQGDTLYVTVKDLPQAENWNPSHPSMSAQVLIPNDVELDVRSAGSNLSLRPRTIAADWTIDGANSALLYVPHESHVSIESIGAGDLKSDVNSKWDVTNEEATDDEWPDDQKSGKIELGEASYQFLLLNSSEVTVVHE